MKAWRNGDPSSVQPQSGLSSHLLMSFFSKSGDSFGAADLTTESWHIPDVAFASKKEPTFWDSIELGY